MLYESIVAGLRGGGDYYRVAADALRQGDFPLRPFVTFRLPTLAVMEAALPDLGVLLLQYALVAAVALAWAVRLRPAFARTPPLLVALVLLAGGLAAFVQSDLAVFHEIWAGLLIALSLALRRPGRWIESVAVGACAMLIRETAALYALVMFVLAVKDGDRREAFGWMVAVAALAVAVLAHAHAVGQVVTDADPASPGWAGMLGPGFFVRAVSLSTALMLAPAWLAALLTGCALFGWSSWRDALGERVLATLLIYGVLLSLFGRPDTFYWALMVAPLLLVGLAFVPDGLANLARRRISPRTPHHRAAGRAVSRILLIVGGGIAAYKACELIRLCRRDAIGVRCVLTDGGAHFVTPMTLAALSEQPVHTSLWDLKDETEMGHIQLSREADLVVVAPATADLLAKMAAGMADDLATTLLLATDKPVLAAPAMNVRMWQHPATVRNIATLRGDSVTVMEPDEGPMACGEYGPGRLPEPAAILAAIRDMLAR